MRPASASGSSVSSARLGHQRRSRRLARTAPGSGGDPHLSREHGTCGACTVIVDGAAVHTCLMLTVQAEGASIVTIEGLSSDEALSPLQTAFRKHHALQCGVCTPGMLTTVRLPSRVIANATQEFVKPRCRMVGDAAQHVGKPSLPIDEPSSARPPRWPVRVLRCSEHVPSASRAVPKRCRKRPGHRISHGQRRFWVLLNGRVDMTSHAFIS
jgi:hypothetical protein